MPRLSVWFIRASLVYLAIGFTFGALILANKGLGFYPVVWNALPIHIEVLLLGWFVQFAFGVAFWILPRLKQDSPRGNETLILVAFVMLNLGIVLIIVETIFKAQGLEWIGRLAEVVGVAAFIVGSWQRVKPTIVP